jgi:uncharacterized repeat protein (TIGR03803 family)
MKLLRNFTVIAASILVIQSVSANATTLTTLWPFTNGADGGNPQSTLVQGSDTNFYGTTSGGGAHGFGTVFQVTPAGVLTNLHVFGGTNDGGASVAGMVFGVDGNLYGTTSAGGSNNVGGVFKITTSGTLTPLWQFSNGPDGGTPAGGVVQGLDGNFYGTTGTGGSNHMGTVFSITSSGSLTTLWQFSGGSDGGQPAAGLVQGIDSNFYGTTSVGGTNSSLGTVFKITSAGTLTTLHRFTGTSTDAAYPFAGLVQGNDNNFYGTTFGGGISGNGVVFRITPLGVYTNLWRFTGGADGANPVSPVIQAIDGNLYGVTSDGGTNEEGNVFRLTSAGTLTSLWQFSGGNDGSFPESGLLQGSDGNFYGETLDGGAALEGTVFKLVASSGGGGSSNTLTQITAIQIVGSNVIITLPSLSTETYQLQTSSLMNPTNWSNVAGAVVAGTGSPVTLTNVGGALLTPQHFYRVDISP